MSSETTGAEAVAEQAHPLALGVWSILRDRSLGDKALLLHACDRRLRRGDMPEKQEQAFYAVSLFVEAEGHVPHAGEWDAWRAARPDMKALPSAGFIRRAFGGWTPLRGAFESTAEVDVLALRLTAQGPKFPDAELSAVLCAWAREQDGPLRAAELQAWLDDDGPQRAGLSRAPSSARTFLRGCKSFVSVLQGAGSDTAPRRPTSERRPEHWLSTPFRVRPCSMSCRLGLRASAARSSSAISWPIWPSFHRVIRFTALGPPQNRRAGWSAGGLTR